MAEKWIDISDAFPPRDPHYKSLSVEVTAKLDNGQEVKAFYAEEHRKWYSTERVKWIKEDVVAWKI